MDRLFHKGNTEVIDIRFQERHDPIHTVAVGVGLHHRHDPGWRNLTANGFQVVF
jgi:hypothetical protein